MRKLVREPKTRCLLNQRIEKNKINDEQSVEKIFNKVLYRLEDGSITNYQNSLQKEKKMEKNIDIQNK